MTTSVVKTINKRKILIGTREKNARLDLEIWRTVRGMWKNKKMPDPVDYQRASRMADERT